MNLFKVGCNFSDDLLKIAIKLNRLYPNNRIEEFYGSRRNSAWLTARPEYRLPDVSKEQFAEFVDILHKNSIEFNYTLNASCIGTKSEIKNNEGKAKQYIEFLVSSGVDTITVSLPYVAKLVRDVSSEIKIEVSTIAHIDSVTQVSIWAEKYDIKKVCISLNKNRDIAFLESIAKHCDKLGIIPTLMVNEFCGNGITGQSGATGCIYREHCYQLHSLGYDREERLDDDYPMGECIASRDIKISWLKMPFIRPEDMKLYNNLGLNHFKITGRTGSTRYIESVIQAYMSESYIGNTLNLWKHLETIKGVTEHDFLPKYFIDNKKLDGFLDYWFDNRNHICANEVCGETCTYCDEFLRRMDEETCRKSYDD